jgi:hypothetical protein
MKGIKTQGVVAELVGRARALSPDARPRWGSLTARQMLCHVGDVVRLVVGEIPAKPRRPRTGRRPFERFPLKHLFLTRDWNRVLYRHTDHHFRQFGI